MAESKSEAFWVTLVDDFEQSKLTRKAFAEAHHIKPSMFHYWLYKIRRKRRLRRNDSLDKTFVRVALDTEVCEGARGKMWLQLAGDISLIFDTPPEPRYLAAVVKALS